MSQSGDSKPNEVVGRIDVFDPMPSIQVAQRALEELGVDYALIGGLALEAWGVSRATKDADFAVPVGAAEAAAARMSVDAAAIQPLRIGGVGIRDPAKNLRIDLIDRRHFYGALYAEAIAEAKLAGRRTRVQDREVPLVGLEYLLATKLVSGEPKDDVDARRILGLDRLDYGRARGIIEQHLGHASANRLEAWAREVGRSEVVKPRLYRNGDQSEE